MTSETGISLRKGGKAKKPDFQVPLPAVFVFAKSAYFLASSTKRTPPINHSIDWRRLKNDWHKSDSPAFIWPAAFKTLDASVFKKNLMFRKSSSPCPRFKPDRTASTYILKISAFSFSLCWWSILFTLSRWQGLITSPVSTCHLYHRLVWHSGAFLTKIKLTQEHAWASSFKVFGSPRAFYSFLHAGRLRCEKHCQWQLVNFRHQTLSFTTLKIFPIMICCGMPEIPINCRC